MGWLHLPQAYDSSNCNDENYEDVNLLGGQALVAIDWAGHTQVCGSLCCNDEHTGDT